MRRVAVFGAGAVGRGFIGEIFSDAGWQVIFIDAADVLVGVLRSGSYPHETVTSAGTERKLVVNCTAIHARDSEAVADAVAGADAIFTCVGAANLPRVAPGLAVGLQCRHETRGVPVDVYLAENLHDAGAVMRRLLEAELDDGHLGPVGLVETSIGRMIPVPTAAQRAEHPALVAVEPYRELPFDRAACRAPVPDVPDLVGRTDVGFAYFSDRKLYLHNMGHCTTAYAGVLAGHDEIAPAISDRRVRNIVEPAMSALARAIASEYRQPLIQVQNNADDLIRRFGNTALHDTVERVGRDPRRKLQPGDRLLGALDLAARHGRAYHMVAPVALGAWYLSREPDDGTTLAAVRASVERHGVGHRFEELYRLLMTETSPTPFFDAAHQ